MHGSTLTRRSLPFSDPARKAGRLLRWSLLVLLLLGWGTTDVLAQPFRMADPFYRNETARRTFFDHVAFSAEVSYRPSSLAPSGDGVAPSTGPLGLRFRGDYQLSERFDVSGIVEAFETGAGRSLSLSWLVVKYYHYLEEADYALRLAVDPSLDGRVGFPQVDLAFLYTSLLSPLISTDFGLGVRRVNVAYAQYQPREEPATLTGPFAISGPLLLSTQAIGTELHLMINSNVHFDPAGSNLYLALLAEERHYDLIETVLNGGERSLAPTSMVEEPDPEDDDEKMEYRDGVVWVRLGAEFNRPSYQVAPYIAAPLQQWRPEGDEWVAARPHVGVQFMLR